MDGSGRLLDPKSAPPPEYYAEKLETVVRQVLSLYGEILSEPEKKFGESVLNLNEDATRLLARLCTRKGPLFSVETLEYHEIENTSQAIQDLIDVGICTSDQDVDVDAAVSIYSLKQLQLAAPEVSKQNRRDLYVEDLKECFSTEELIDRLFSLVPWLNFVSRESLEILSFLYFGNLYEDLSTFVLTDLGLRTYETYTLDKSTRIFQSKDALERFWNVHRMHVAYDEILERCDSKDLMHLAQAIGPASENVVIERQRSRFLNRLARDLERQSALSEAYQVYRLSSMHPARERSVRCLQKLGKIKHQKRLVKEIDTKPWTLEEHEFVKSRGRRFKEEELCNVELKYLSIGEQYASIEDHAADQIRSENTTVFHLENSIPTGLFALSHWNWIFAAVEGAFVNEFQSAPVDLFMPEFFEKRQSVLEDPLSDPALLKDRMIDTARKKRGLSCHGMNWEVWTEEFTELFLGAVPINVMINLLHVMKRDLRQMWAGFPDLTIIREGNHVEFIEVKGPGDRLQLNQRIWIRALVEQSIPVSVMRFKKVV